MPAHQPIKALLPAQADQLIHHCAWLCEQLHQSCLVQLKQDSRHHLEAGLPLPLQEMESLYSADALLCAMSPLQHVQAYRRTNHCYRQACSGDKLLSVGTRGNLLKEATRDAFCQLCCVLVSVHHVQHKGRRECNGRFNSK